MKTLFLLLTLSCLCFYCEGIQDYLSNSLYPCIKCLCHARTGCWRRKNCADYSINFDYWKIAGKLTTNDKIHENEQVSYKKCIQNENCIVGTIIEYTQKFGKVDCNCDGSYDCKDRLAIHLFGNNCNNPKYGPKIAARFNECSAGINLSPMTAVEDGCLPEAN